MKKEHDFDSLRYCLNNYKVNGIFIRLIGSMGGDTKVRTSLTSKLLDFKKDDSGLKFFIDSKEVMHFPLKDYTKGFSLQYERFHDDGRIFFYNGIPNNPNEKGLPKIENSIFRGALDWHLVEISFKDKIPLKKDGWLNKPYLNYWRMDKKNK